MMEDVILDIFPVFFFCFKIGAGIIDHLTTVKYQFQITELQPVQINFFHMKDPTGSCKLRGGKNFSYRNVHICHTVLKIRLFLRICQLMKMDQKIRLIISTAFDLHPLTGVQSIDDRLLDLLIKMIIQSIDLYDLTENFLIISTDLRNRIGNNGKTSLITFNVTVYDLSGFIVKLCLQFLLCLT